MPRVSILTALYNHERFIAQAIDSVRAQTFGDWELLIWDDGSTDRGLELARARAADDARIKVFTHPGQANRGQENTRNAALERAQGGLIGLLDSDDYYKPNKLAALVPCFEDQRVGLAYGRADTLLDRDAHAGAATLTQPLAITRCPSGRVFDELVQDNFICAGATLFRRECVASGLRFDAAFRTIGEYPLWLKIARDYELRFVDETVAVWRSHGANLGTRLALQAKAELVELCLRLASDAGYADHLPAIRRACARKRYDYASELYLQLKLSETREQCLGALAENAADPAIRAKAAALAAMTLLGPSMGGVLSRVKRRVWELRNRV